MSQIVSTDDMTDTGAWQRIRKHLGTVRAFYLKSEQEVREMDPLSPAHELYGFWAKDVQELIDSMEDGVEWHNGVPVVIDPRQSSFAASEVEP